MNDPAELWLDVDEAAALLEVKRETLYAYASRGILRTRPRGRRRQYSREDLLRLRARSDARSGHGAVAASALDWGEPVLDTAVSAIDPVRGPLYRGASALDFAARGTPFEEVAAHLWNVPAVAPWTVGKLGLPLATIVRESPRSRGLLERLALSVALQGLRDPDRFVTTADWELACARRLIARMVASLADDEERARAALASRSLAAAVCEALGAPASRAPAVDRALVLSADHELNASTFAARVVASTGADLYACVGGALAAMSGPVHGRASDRVVALLETFDRPEDATAVVRDRLARGEPLPGVGHPLYASGDPRGADLIEAAAALDRRSMTVRKIVALREALRLAGAGEPTLDQGLVAIAAAARLPAGSASALFAIGRTAGWVAHVREQRETGRPLRPRARYIGNRLDDPRADGPA